MVLMSPASANLTAMTTKVQALMPGIIADLERLVAIPSVAFPGHPPEPVRSAAAATAHLLERSGLTGVRLLEIPGGYPAVFGEIAAPPGAPTVLFYAHYDVVPAKREDGWETDPWRPVVKDGRLYGRGAADNKAGIASIAGSIQALAGNYPVGIKVIVEGEEETTGHLEAYVKDHPDLFRCDVFVITDMGKIVGNEPVLSTTLRGEVSLIVRVQALARAVHSGMFGGAAPDALIALIRMLATLHDENGDVAVAGLASSPWTGAEYPRDLYRRLSGLLDGVDIVGTAPISTQLWAKPSINVIGIDAPSIKDATNILIPEAKAKVSMRIAPGADPQREIRLLEAHLRAAAPWNVRVVIDHAGGSAGFICPTGGSALAAAKDALEAVYKRQVAETGAGGSIPLLSGLQQAVPGAEFILWGCEDDERSQIHGANESVDLKELERMIVVQVLLLQELGRGKNSGCRVNTAGVPLKTPAVLRETRNLP